MRALLPHVGERGDTLVEVTIALGILSLVLVSAFATADAAFKLGQTSKERSVLANIGQQQADGLKSFRDSHTWNQFVYGSSGASYPACDNAPTDYCGISARHAADCDTTAPGMQWCFHMELRNINENGTLVTEWVPIYGDYQGLGGHDVVGGGQVAFNVGTTPDPGLGTPPYYYYDFSLDFGNNRVGSAANTYNYGNMMVRLVSLDSLR